MKKYIIHLLYLFICCLMYYIFVHYVLIEYFPFFISVIVVLYMISFLKKKFDHYRLKGVFLLFIIYFLLSIMILFLVIFGIATIYHFILQSKVYYNLYLLPQLEQLINILGVKEINQLLTYSNNLINSLLTGIINYCMNILSFIPSLFSSYFIIIVSSFVFCLSYDEVKRYLIKYIPNHLLYRINHLKNLVLDTIKNYFVTQMQMMFIVFLCLFLGFSVLKLNYKFILAFSLALLDALPFIGIGIGIIPMIIYFLLCKSYFKSFYLFILYLFIYVLRTFLENYLMKNKLNIPSYFVFISFFIHYHLFGFTGIIISPLTLCLIHSFLDNSKRIK